MTARGAIKLDPDSPLAIRLRTANKFITERLAASPLTRTELREQARADRAVNVQAVNVLLHSSLAEGIIVADDDGKLTCA